MYEKNNSTLKSVPFSWNDNLSDEATEYFDSYRSCLPYCACQSIGMALAKLKLIENGDLIKNENGEWEDGREKIN